MDERINGYIKGCKVCRVLLWIGCGMSAAVAVISAFSLLAMGTVGSSVFTVAILCGMAVLDGWMAKSVTGLLKEYLTFFQPEDKR